MSEDDDAEKKPKKRRAPKKITASYLENSAAHYLGRFAASTAQLRDVMMRKVRRSASHHGTDQGEGAKMVDDVIAKFERLGYLNDGSFAEMKARSLHGRGTPVRGIRYKLKQNGLGEGDIENALAKLSDEEEAPDLDMRAAVRLAERRRLGPFNPDEEARRERREKDLATLARAGFSYDVAERVIGADSAQELLDDYA